MTTTHNAALFTELEALCAQGPIMTRAGKMFGCPALYVGRKMALCVYEDSIGMRVPEAVALEAKAASRAGAFTPYGKKPMREWIAVDTPDDLSEFHDLFDAALQFAQENNGVT
jgi:TfoX/Sxy family transcriptional regulator of competence genes